MQCTAIHGLAQAPIKLFEHKKVALMSRDSDKSF